MRDSLFVFGENYITVFDGNLSEMASFEINQYRDTIIHHKMYVISEEPNKTSVRCFGSPIKMDWLLEVAGNYLSCDFTDNFLVISTNEGTECFNSQLEKKWKQPKANCVKCFNDETDHVIIARENELSITELETGIICWKKSLDFPICELEASKDGVVVCTFAGGGVHYFGDYS